MSKVKSSIKNGVSAVFLQIIGILLGLFLRKIMIKDLGIDNVGLNVAISNLITVLSLTELGIMNAMTFALYKPLEEKNWNQIAAIMRAFRRIYHVIAVLIFIMGVLLIPAFLFIIGDTEFDKAYTLTVYLLNVIASASSYLFSYNRTLIVADQRAYIVSLISLIGNIVSVLLGIIIIAVTRNLIFYSIWLIAIGLIINIYMTKIVKRKYIQVYNAKYPEMPENFYKQLVHNTKDLFLSKLSATISSSSDGILVTFFSGIGITGFYSNYQTIINQIKGITTQLFEACSASMGSLVASGNKERGETVLEQLNFIAFLIATFSSICLFNLLTPFVGFFYGKDNTMEKHFVLILVLVFYFLTVREPILISVRATGLFRQDKYVAILIMLTNIISSIILGYNIGIKGVFIGTILSQMVCLFGKTYIYYCLYLHKSILKPILQQIFWGMVAIAGIILSNIFICHLNINIIFEQLVINFLVSLVTFFLIFLCFIKTQECESTIKLIKRILRRDGRL